MWEENKFFPPSNPGRLAHIFVVFEAVPVELKSRFIFVFIISIQKVTFLRRYYSSIPLYLAKV
jgi:hypothetical protein